MALSGSNYKSFARHRLVAEWTATQNVASNQSTVTVKVFLQSVDAYGAMSAPASNAGSVEVGTTTKNFTATSQLSANQKKQLTSQSFVVSHNANGTASFNYSVTYNINVTFAGVFYGNQTVTGSGTLNTIPRASSIASIVGNQIGGNVTVNITRASSSFKHIVKYTNTAGNVATVGENVDTSKTFTISMNDCSHLPNSTSGTAKITVDTYSGDSRIGSVTSNHTVYVPDSVKPKFEWVTIKELNDSIKKLNLGENRFVQGKSNLQMQVHGTAPYGATINKASVGITHVHTIQSHIGSISLSDFPWAVGENLQLVGTITDSRGRSASGSIGFTILPFSNPVIHSFSASRINNGTSISVFKRIEASRVDVNKTDYVVYVDRKINGGWTQIHSENSTNVETITLSGFDLELSHELRLRVDDYFQSVSSMTTISTSKTLMDFNKDIGVGIGKVHEKGALDVGGDTYLDGNIFMSSTKTIQGGGGFWNGYLPPGDMKESSYWHQTVFPKGYSLWGKTPDTGQIGDPNDYNGYALVTVFKDNYGASEFTVMYYNQPNGRVFRLGGNYGNSRLIFYELYSEATPGIHKDYSPPELWSGATYMGANQTATPSKPLANCRNGWMLVWSDYTNGVANNYDWVFTPIPKTAVSAGVSGMHAIVANSSAANAPMLSKYIYVGTGTKIVGHSNNKLAGLDNIVLRKVYEW